MAFENFPPSCWKSHVGLDSGKLAAKVKPFRDVVAPVDSAANVRLRVGVQLFFMAVGGVDSAGVAWGMVDSK